MKIVLAICGKAGSGKDAFASTLIEKGFVPIKFASSQERDTYTVPIERR
jgi:dephospho-CoA kinase